MRLIDADKLHPDRMTNKGTVAISQSQIAKAPTVDVLEQIRAEIEDYVCNKEENTMKAQGMLNALQIMNEHMK